MTDQAQRIAQQYLTARKLDLGPGRVDPKATESLAKIRLRGRSNGSLDEAIISAGFYAKKTGQVAYVYAGNSYGHAVWRVSFKASEYLNPINNTGTRMLSVTPDLVVSVYDVKRDSSA